MTPNQIVLDKAAVKKEARKMLNEGKSRQETFELLVNEHKVARDIAEIIKQLPSLKAVKKFALWNNILLGLLLVKAVMFVWEDMSFAILILWLGFLGYVVYNRLIHLYIVVTASSTIGLLAGVGFYIFSEYEIEIPMLLFFVVFASTLIISFWLEKKLCPPPSERKELYTTEDGQQRMKIVYEFED
jgi:hypothetical protein